MSLPPRSSDRHVKPIIAARDRQEIETQLDHLLDPVLSSRRTSRPLAEPVARLSRVHQDFVLHWAAVIARTNIELAFQFVAAAPMHVVTLSADAAEKWIVEAMDVYDRDGLYRATEVLTTAPNVQTAARSVAAVELENILQVLQLFLKGLSGRRLRIEAAAQCYTDTEALYLPARIDWGATRELSFFLYKATAVLLWAQSRYGTFNVDLNRACARFDDPPQALRLLALLESLRLEAQIAATLPRLARDMRALRGTVVDSRLAPLFEFAATVETSILVLEAVYERPPPIANPYGITLQPNRARACRNARIVREKAQLRAALPQLAEDASYNPDSQYTLEAADPETALPESTARYVLHHEGRTVSVGPELAELIESVVQDLGSVPDDYLMLGPDGSDRATRGRIEPEAANRAVEPESTPVFFYNEWDYLRRHYRKSWCALRERETQPGDADFVDATLEKYAAQIAQLKRTFELMRGEERLLKRQPEGDGIDLDALLDAYGDMRAGAELTSLLFTRRHKHERDLAVMFMVDMSGSTKGWINQAEREALVMLCEALEVLGDRYAIYGFSGMTRKRCETFRVKRFDEPYSPIVHRRIAGMQPQDYTRMGVAIRHLTTLLNHVQARTKLLITLSDGKPDDYGSEYRGEYGIEDTRQALIEAHRSGIKSFCITIDNEAREYLPHMYGAANWTLVDDIAQLPVRVANIYQRLTR
jgi:nitric oxide reductase NorD protein